MKRLLVVLLLSFFLFSALSCTEEKAVKEDNKTEITWIEDYQLALNRAKNEDKVILINFTGSDWCKWCIKLVDEVFSHKEFADYAEENLVMLKIDFPTTFKQLPEEEQIKRQQLQQQYGVRGYPTIILADAQGKVLGQTGYQPGGPENYVNHLKEMIKK